jgi:SAM-dependent methyltransferase
VYQVTSPFVDYPSKLLRVMRWYAQSSAALRYGTRKHIPGLAFAHYGRQIGRQLLRNGERIGLTFLLTPVNITRYFEFQFALDCLPDKVGDCLDVSSPRLFSLYLRAHDRLASLRILNPDRRDLEETELIAKQLHLPQIELACEGVDALPGYGRQFDCIWSISVIEHIAGAYDDTHAVKLMFDVLRPGGRLILTVPVDRTHWDETRAQPVYGDAASIETTEEHFFQRFYTAETIQKRLLAPIGRSPTRIAWFGETEPGRFHRYVERWMVEGTAATIDDPREIADFYRSYASWNEMPGVGVCGILLEK